MAIAADLNAMMSSLSSWEVAGYVSTAAVTLGCLGEFVHEFTAWFKKCSWWELKGGKASALLLIFALAVEIPIQVKANSVSGLVIGFLSERTAAAELELAKIKQPRTLTVNRQKFVTNAAAPFRGQRYRAAISQGADDGIAFWESLYAALDKAGWVYLPALSIGMGSPIAGIPLAAIPGVEIRFDPAKENELVPRAMALGIALHADGMTVAVDRNTQSDPNEAERNILLIVIGARVPRE